MREIVIDGNETYDFISVLINNADVEDVEFRNCDFYNEDMVKVASYKTYKRIAFIDCVFEDASLIKNISTKSLSLNNNKIDNYNFVYEMPYLKNLTIVKGYIDAERLNSIENLEYLRLSHSNVINIEKIPTTKLKNLFIDNTNIKNLSFVLYIPNLELLSVSEDQINENIDILKSISNKVRIIMDSIIEMGVDLYD